MSTTLVNKVIPLASNYFGKFSRVDSERETLADFVRRIRNEKGLSMAQVAERSGGLIAQSYFFKIENGLVKNVSIEKLRAIARGLGISEEELLRVARGKPKSVDEDLESSEFALLYSKHTRLTAQQKRDFKKVIEMVDRELDRELERGEKEGKK